MINFDRNIQAYCTRPRCPQPENIISLQEMKTVIDGGTVLCLCEQCQMPLILQGSINGGLYLPIERRSAGGFGRTFIAYKLESDGTLRKSVVKQFCPEQKLSGDILESAKQRFRKEADILKELGENYRKFPELYDFCSILASPYHPNLQYREEESPQEEFIYIVQEFINGKTLEEELEETPNGCFSEEKVKEIFVEILNLLKILNEHQLIHRDIKPSNIMHHAPTNRMYLIDFGAVKELKKPQELHSQYLPSTPLFAAPEQFSGEKASSSGDLYSLAATCVYLLTGSFSHYHWQEDERVKNSSLYPIFTKMLAFNPSERFQSAQEVLDAFNSGKTTIMLEGKVSKSGAKTIIMSDDNESALKENKTIVTRDTNQIKSLPSKPQYLNKRIVTVLGLIILSGVGVGLLNTWKPSILANIASIFTSTPSLTESYQDPEQQFSIKYPEVWQLQRLDDLIFKNVLKIMPKKYLNEPRLPVQLLLNIEPLDTILSLDEYMDLSKNRVKAFINSSKIIDSTTNATLSNFPAYRLVYQGLDESRKSQKFMEVGTIRGDKAYVLIYIADDDLYDKFEPSAQQIIDSFEILTP